METLATGWVALYAVLMCASPDTAWLRLGGLEVLVRSTSGLGSAERQSPRQVGCYCEDGRDGLLTGSVALGPIVAGGVRKVGACSCGAGGWRKMLSSY